MGLQNHPGKEEEDVLIRDASSATLERHFSVAEISSMWNLSKDAVRRMFQNEPGVLVLGDGTTKRKRRYTTLRIPQSVLERVHAKCSLYR